MASSSSGERVDILIKVAIVAGLLAAMVLFHGLATVPMEGFDPRGLLSLGFVILAAYAIGELAEVFGLPHITGYLLAGLALGHSASVYLHAAFPDLVLPAPLDDGVLSEAVVQQLSPLNDLALALIALTAGGELRLKGLREGFRAIMAILVSQAIIVPIVVIGTFVAIPQLMPGSVPVLAAMSTASLVALGSVVAALGFATSPAATIAVINSLGAKGPMARTVLSTVVLKDVFVITAFAATTTFAIGFVGGEGEGLETAFLHIGAAILGGVLLGIFIDAYLRYVGGELLLFLVAMIYTATFLVQEVGGEPALMFIVAGLVVGNFSSRGETLIHEVERLAMPVYVVFFTLAGANLHLDLIVSMAGPAVLLVGTRIVAMFVATRIGGLVGNAEPVVQRYGWLGFISQAGVVIALATKAKDEVFTGEIGDTLFSLLLAGVAINEVIGPVMLQFGLGYAGESADAKPEVETESKGPATSGELSTWNAEPVDEHVWGRPLPTGEPLLDEAVEELGTDMRQIAHDQTNLPLIDRRRDAEAWIRQLRREFLRIARRASVRQGQGTEIAARLRNDIGDLGERWRDLVIDRAARATRRDQWSPIELVEAIDAHIATLSERFDAPVHPDLLQRRPESWWRALRRRWLWLRVRLFRLRREVPLRQLGRYQFSGRVPSRLEGLAALLINGDLHLANRVNTLFRLAADGLEATALAAEQEGAAATAERLTALRGEVDAEFRIALEELTAISEDGQTRTARVLGHALQALREDVKTVGTLDLPLRKRRYSRVFTERNEGIGLLTDGLPAARDVVEGRFHQLALELELVGLEGRIRDAVRHHADRLVRQLRGRGPTQLRRVENTLGQWLDETRALLNEPPDAETLGQTLRQSSEPVVHAIAEAQSVMRELTDALTEEAWVTALLDDLRRPVQGLTEFYEVPTGRPITGEWALPKPIPTTEIAFRDLVAGLLEVQVSRELLDLTVELTAQFRETLAVLVELERVVAFNVELAGAELDVLDEGAAVGPETGDLVQAMVVGAIGRSHARLDPLARSANELVDATDERITKAVIGGMTQLRETILDGRIADLRSQWLREAPLGRTFARRAQRFGGWFPNALDRISEFGNRALGEDRMLAIRAVLGLPELGDERDLRSALSPPRPATDVPLVYRRLFSEQALEAGDLLSGREVQLDRLRTALSTTGGFRTAAVVSLDRQAALAVVNAAIRSSHVVRWSAESPVDQAQLDEWFDALPAERRTVVIPELRWWFRREPGGFVSLRGLVQRIIADQGRHAFVVVADESVWRFVADNTGLAQAMATVVRLGPLDVEQLEQALTSRHAMSGYDVRFEAEDDLGWQIQHTLLRGNDRDRRRKTAWFGTLHAASAGVLQDALRLWMASIVSVDEGQGRLRIGKVPRPPLTRLAELREPELLTLLEVTRQGWMTSALHSRLFRTEAGWSTAHLAQLRQVGLLVEAGDVLQLAPHLRGALHRVFVRRNWA
ncbi:MAG: cation:proton antiporter [Myxococcota bacterium]